MRLCVVFGCNGSSNSGASPSPSLWDSQISSMSTRKWSLGCCFFSFYEINTVYRLSQVHEHTERSGGPKTSLFFWQTLVIDVAIKKTKKNKKNLELCFWMVKGSDLIQQMKRTCYSLPFYVL